MSEFVTIKVLRSGILLELDKELPFAGLIREVNKSFSEASSFLGDRKVCLVIRGRELSPKEENEVLRAIAENTKMKVVCVLDDDEKMENTMHRYLDSSADTSLIEWQQRLQARENELAQKNQDLRNREANIERQFRIRQNQIMEQKNALSGAISQMRTVLTGDVCQIYKGDVRSGQNLTSKHSIIVMGNVNPGGRVTTDGCIFIMGSLMGEAVAGDKGDTNAFIMAMDFHPLQIRIAGRIAVTPGEDAGKNGRVSRRQQRRLGKKEEAPLAEGPQVAYIWDGKLGKSAYDDEFLARNQFFRGQQ